MSFSSSCRYDIGLHVASILVACENLNHSRDWSISWAIHWCWRPYSLQQGLAIYLHLQSPTTLPADCFQTVAMISPSWSHTSDAQACCLGQILAAQNAAVGDIPRLLFLRVPLIWFYLEMKPSVPSKLIFARLEGPSPSREKRKSLRKVRTSEKDYNS